MKIITYTLAIGLISLCSLNLFSQNIGNGDLNVCTGMIYDSGGSGSNYSDDEDFSETYCSDGGNCISVDFYSFSLESDWDYLYIYDGPSVWDPLIGTYTGTTLPGVINSTTGCLTFKMVSDGSTSKPGWEAAVYCSPCTICTDGIKNGDEVGVDCGGSCPDICSGSDCLNPIVINALPFSLADLSTEGMGNDYGDSDACVNNYMSGNDIVFEYTATSVDSCIVLSLFNASTSWGGIFLLDGCPDSLNTNCIENATGSATLTLNPNLVAGTTYYIVVASSNLAPELTFDFRMTNDCEAECGGNPDADDVCANATYISNLDGFCGNTSGTYTAGDIPSSFCGTIENNSWLRFTADSTVAILNVYVSNCSFGSGIQIEIYETTDCVSFSSVSNCWNPATETDGVITATGLTVGNDYYVMVDGNGGDICDYTIGASAGVVVLPISLSSYTANCYQNDVLLEWTTLSEMGNEYFLVERTFNGVDYTVVATVKGSGHSSQAVNYQWIDNAPGASEAYYRLRQVDYDGKFECTSMIRSRCMNEEEELKFKIYPNPFASKLTIELNSKTIDKIDVEISNQFGHTLFKKKLSVKYRKASFELDDSISAGCYFVKAAIGNQLFIEKLIKK